MIKKVNSHVDRARAGLEKQSSDLEELLGQYRSTNKCGKDIVMFLILLALVAINYKLLVWKEWIPGGFTS